MGILSDKKIETHIKIYANEGIAQIIFLRGEEVYRMSYADKRGKYQDPHGLTLPKMD